MTGRANRRGVAYRISGSALEIDIKCSIFALKIGGPLRKGIDYRAFSLIGECSTSFINRMRSPGGIGPQSQSNGFLYKHEHLFSLWSKSKPLCHLASAWSSSGSKKQYPSGVKVAYHWGPLYLCTNTGRNCSFKPSNGISLTSKKNLCAQVSH